MVGRKPISASHWDEYIAKANEASHGPGARNVRRMRPLPAVVRPAASADAGTLHQRPPVIKADSSYSNHHQPGQPARAMKAGPSSRATAVPKGMYAPHHPSMPLKRAVSTSRRINPGAGKVASRKPTPSHPRSTSNASTLRTVP